MPAFLARRKVQTRRNQGGGSPTINPPASVTATAGAGQIGLAWSAVDGATYYRIRRATASGGPYTQINTNGTTTGTTYVDSDVSGTDPYYYVIRAFDATRNLVSADSVEVNATLPQQGGANRLTPGTLTAFEGFASLGLKLDFDGDPLAEIENTLEYSLDGGATWLDATPLLRVQQRLSYPIVAIPGSTTTMNGTVLASNQIESDGPNTLGPPSTASTFVGWRIDILDGATLEVKGESRTITNYTGYVNSQTQQTPAVITVNQDWSVAPAVGDYYVVQNPAVGQRFLLQSIMNLPSASPVRVRITLTHADGVNGENPIIRDYATRAEDIPDHATVWAACTRFLSASGSDSNTGTALSPWRTVAKGAEYINAGDGTAPRWVGCLGAGRYTPREVTITKPGGFVGEYIPFDDTHASCTNVDGTTVAYDPAMGEVNASNRTIFEYGLTTGPSGANGTLDATTAWSQVGYPGEKNTGLSNTVWVWDTGVAGIEFLGFAENYGEKVIDLPMWQKVLPGMSTDGGNVEFIFGNDLWNYGWAESKTVPGRILLRMPPYVLNYAATDNPRNLYMFAGKGNAFNVAVSGTPTAGANFRLCGVEAYGYRQLINATASSCYIVTDHNLICAIKWPVYFQTTASPLTYSHHHVVEHNKFYAASLRALPGEDPNDYINRLWIKNDTIYTYNGTTYKKQRIGDNHENHCMRAEGGAQNTAFRYNVVDGYFNGPNMYNDGTYSYLSSVGNEVYRNRFYNIADDCVEYESYAPLLRIFENRAEYVGVFVTLADGRYGPVHVLRNEVWQLGVEEVNERSRVGLGRKLTALFFKIGGKNLPWPTVYAVNNTLWSDRGEADHGYANQFFTNASGTVTNVARPRFWQVTNDGAPGERPNMFLVNNIVRCVEDCIQSGDRITGVSHVDGVDGQVNDYNLWASQDGIRYNNQVFTDITAYRARFAPLAGNLTNLNNQYDGVARALTDRSWIDALLSDTAAGNITLDPTAGAAGLDAGRDLDNLTAWAAGTIPFGAGTLTFLP